jgi:flagellar basal body rod protein FlgG/flagellar basal body-associated protein FliL
MSLSPKHRLIVCLCLTFSVWPRPVGGAPRQALDNTVPEPQLAQSDPAYRQLIKALEQVGHARDAVVGNLSHAHVTAYKRNRVRFTGSGSISIMRDVRPGGLVHTGRTLDWAIKDRGWFQLTLPDGRIGYTRQGSFMVNAEGLIVSEQGFELEPAISLPDAYQAVEVGSDGTVFCFQDNGDVLHIGVVQLARFASPESLKHHDQGVYFESEAAGCPTLGTPGEDGFGSIQGGFLENANVNALEEQHLLEDLSRYEAQLHQAVSQLRQRSPAIADAKGRQTTGFEVPLEMLHAGLEFRNCFEQRLKDKAENLLFALVGPQRARVSVSAELDLDFARVTTEKPSIGHPVTEQVETTVEEGYAHEEAEPGEPKDETKTSKSTSIAYSVGQVVEKRVSLPGDVVGISVAVLIDLRESSGKDGRLRMSIEDVDQLLRAGLGLKPSDTLVVKQVALVASQQTRAVQKKPYTYNIKPLVSNLKNPGARRFIRAGFVLAIHPNYDQELAQPILDGKKDKIRHFLSLYFAGLQVEQLQGRANLTKSLQEIKEGLNALMPQMSPPLIAEILYDELAIQ